MQDLNDLYYFAMVVEHGGFAAAERALGIPKSRLSRRISQLESDLGVRLLQRSTRRFAVTDVGTSVYRHAQTMLAEAQAAREVVDRLSAQPRGVVRVSVPVSLAQQEIPAMLPDFLALYPEVRVQLLVSNRRFDLINEGVDVALRVRSKLEDDGSLVLRTFGPIQSLLVATPGYLDGMGRPKLPADLAEHVTLSMG
jgi:DNA-binding transcriptional LysR family regulator